MRTIPSRQRSTLLCVLLLWITFYASFTLFTPPLLDDADSVHAEVAREMLLRHDYVTLHANGIRYLEKAPLLYWSMAACMKLFLLAGANTPRALAAAARLPLAFTVLALALLCEAFARRLFRSTWAGLYAALIVLSSFGIFIFTRILIPDAMVCLWLTLALYAFWRSTEHPAQQSSSRPERIARSGETCSSFPPPQSSPISMSSRPESRSDAAERPAFLHRIHQQRWPLLFATACALNVLTKGLIGVVFPLAIVIIYLLLTRKISQTAHSLRTLLSPTAIILFFAIAAPWHVLAGLANPTQGHPAAFHFINGHWQVPLPTDGNVRGWFWFYFMNEHLLRYLNLRVPHDYDTSPLWLFWGLCFAWILPWSAFVLRALYVPMRNYFRTLQHSLHGSPAHSSSGRLLLCVSASFVLLFYSLSTRQEYYVLPALPALAILIGGWLAREASSGKKPVSPCARTDRRAATIGVSAWLVIGSIYAVVSAWLLLHMQAPAPNTDLSTLLTQNPSDYALSMGHFLDLNARALGLFRLPLALSAFSLFAGPLAALLLRRRNQRHAANLTLAAATFCFLLAAFDALHTFAPVLGSAQMAAAIAPQLHADDLVVIHGEYEAGSTLAFYLQRDDIHILGGRSSNLWYGSFFPDAPHIFETPQSIAEKWNGPQRLFMWQSTTDEPRTLPPLPGPVYVVAQSGGKEIVSNRRSD